MYDSLLFVRQDSTLNIQLLIKIELQLQNEDSWTSLTDGFTAGGARTKYKVQSEHVAPLLSILNMRKITF